MPAFTTDPMLAPVLILGTGVNGLCVARELVLNGVPVVIVDTSDLGGGASAKSSRLIHGGLRYLEYGEFRLVRESLDERTRLLKLAPNLVRPLKLHIPLCRRRGGLLHAALRFIGLGRVPWIQRTLDALGIRAERGRWAAQIGLSLYDWISRRGRLPKHAVAPVLESTKPPLDSKHYRWICSYWDAQMPAPERFCVALARDTTSAAKASGVPFQLLTYHRARLADVDVEITPTLPVASEAPLRFRPSMIINATGAWGDLTLESLPIPAPRLFGGTRGSHILTRQPHLKAAIGDAGIYAEAPDGRLVFILPWAESVLVGTTDERFDGSPETAVATSEEIQYLVGMVNFVFPQVGLTERDVAAHYSGIRPLPYVAAGRTAAISRDHAVDTRLTPSGLRIDTLVGGKLTTCRALGEQVADRVLAHLGVSRSEDTRDRPIPGGRDYPRSAAEQAAALQQLSTEFGLSLEGAHVVWNLFGSESFDVLCDAGMRSAEPRLSHADVLPGSSLPLAVVDWMIRHEHVRTVADLVERRLLFVFAPELRYETLLVLEQRLRVVLGGIPQGATAAADSLQRHYGISLAR